MNGKKVYDVFAGKLGRLGVVVFVHIIALLIAWLNLVRIYPSESATFFDSTSICLITSSISLPLSLLHIVQGIGDQGVIPIGGRPGQLLLNLAVSLAGFVAFIVYIIQGNKITGLLGALYLLLAAPYWAYYSYGLMGI